MLLRNLDNYIQWVLFYFEKISFDKRYKVKTSFVTPRQKLDFDGYLKKNSARYRPTPVIELKKIIRKLKKIEPSIVESAFLDYGCGAGRVLIVAAAEGFSAAIGVELSPSLVSSARANINNFQIKYPNSEIEIIQKDAREYAPSLNVRTFFFYLPFSQAIFDEVLKQIRKSISNNQRTAYIVTFFAGYEFDEGWTLIAEGKRYKIWKSTF